MQNLSCCCAAKGIAPAGITSNMIPAMRNRSREQISAQMSRIRKTDTRPELVVRSLAHRMGYRFRLYRRDLPGTPDLVFPSRQKVIFVHGCFWHQHACSRGRKQPKTNRDYWLPKLTRNVSRDSRVQGQLASLGWKALVVWECETGDPLMLSSRNKAFLSNVEPP